MELLILVHETAVLAKRCAHIRCQLVQGIQRFLGVGGHELVNDRQLQKFSGGDNLVQVGGGMVRV